MVGITGSTGKTSTKDILAALLAPHTAVVASRQNENNELGVPLTLARIEPITDVAVVEMAMRGLGQIAHLAAIARPGIGIVTGVGPVHLELLGTIERWPRPRPSCWRRCRRTAPRSCRTASRCWRRTWPGSRCPVVSFGSEAGADVQLRGFTAGRRPPGRRRSRSAVEPCPCP